MENPRHNKRTPTWELIAFNWKFFGTTGTLAPAFVNSHISPKSGEIWGTLVRGKERRPSAKQ
jgi:hypothetical protein